MTSTTTSSESPSVAAAITLLCEVLPEIPTLAGCDPVPVAFNRVGPDLAGLLAQALQSGVTRDDEVAALVLATLITMQPAALLGTVIFALDAVVNDIDHGVLETDASGNALPRIEHDDTRPISDGFHYVLAGATT